MKIKKVMHKRKTTKLTNTKSCEYFYHKYETKYEEHVVKTKDKFLQTQKSQKHRQQDDIKSVLLCRALSIITTHSASVTHSTTHSTPSTHSVSHHSVSVTSHLLSHPLGLNHPLSQPLGLSHPLSQSLGLIHPLSHPLDLSHHYVRASHGIRQKPLFLAVAVTVVMTPASPNIFVTTVEWSPMLYD